MAVFGKSIIIVVKISSTRMGCTPSSESSSNIEVFFLGVHSGSLSSSSSSTSLPESVKLPNSKHRKLTLGFNGVVCGIGCPCIPIAEVGMNELSQGIGRLKSRIDQGKFDSS
ncbi:hypothetical protein SNE40_009618 [Patella caerulea]|uniref:Uncharacterized protein n=1 Tax=Patella caerulea TaxID=87958 RepID=A0AAN8JSJ5_PATCE